MKNKEIIGKKFNKMTILEVIKKGRVNCRCDCGNIKECSLYDLKRERIKGCGCQRNTPELRLKAKTRAYKLIEDGILNRGGDFHQKENREFKYCFKTINLRERKGCFVNLNDLKEIWEKQNGYCAYSNVKLILPTHSNTSPVVAYRMASVDRIDSKKPYTKDNIQFVSRTINYAKNSMSHQEMCTFINIIKCGGEGLNLKTDFSVCSENEH